MSRAFIFLFEKENTLISRKPVARTLLSANCRNQSKYKDFKNKIGR
jgi:hypothetical protein